VPRLLNYIVAVYLILIGIIGLSARLWSVHRSRPVPGAGRFHTLTWPGVRPWSRVTPKVVSPAPGWLRRRAPVYGKPGLLAYVFAGSGWCCHRRRTSGAVRCEGGPVMQTIMQS